MFFWILWLTQIHFGVFVTLEVTGMVLFREKERKKKKSKKRCVMAWMCVVSVHHVCHGVISFVCLIKFQWCRLTRGDMVPQRSQTVDVDTTVKYKWHWDWLETEYAGETFWIFLNSRLLLKHDCFSLKIRDKSYQEKLWNSSKLL